jgi:hypothetical protein
MAAGPETRKNVADLQRRIIELEKRLDAKD